MKNGQTRTTDTLANFLKRGNFLLHENQLEAAEKIYQQIHEQLPEHVEAIYGLGVIAFQRDQRHAAEVFFEEVLSHQPTHIPSLEYLALMAFEEQNWSKAKSYIDQLIHLNSPNINREKLSSLALSLQPESLTHHYPDQSLIIKSDYLDVLRRMGDYYYEKSDYVRAENFYKRALLIQPNQVNCLIGLGLSKHQRGDEINALRYSEMVLKLEPENITAKKNIDEIKQSQEKITQSEQYYLKSFKINPKAQEALDKLGVLYEAKREYEKAKNFYERSLLVNPNVVKTLTRLANLYDIEGNSTKAKQYYQQILSFEPNQVNALNQLGLLLLRENNFASAEHYFLRALAVNDYDAHTYLNLAKLYLHQNQWLDAEQWAQKALKINPKLAQAYGLLAQSSAHQKQFDQALKLFHQALAYSPEDTELLQDLANTYRDMDKFDQAILYYQQALDAYSHLDRQNLNRVRIQLREEQCRYSLSLIELLQGNLLNGLANYHARKSIGLNSIELPNFIPSWNGQDNLTGKTVYVFNESGLADFILLLRFAEHLKAQEARVIVYSDPYWHEFIKTCPWVDGVVSHFTELDPNNSYQVLASDLPYYFDLRYETIPNTTPYCSVRDEARLRQNNQLQLHQHANKKITIGLNWISDTENTSAGQLRLDVFSRLFRQASLNTFALCASELRSDIQSQVDNELQRFSSFVHDTRGWMHSLEDLAALIAQLDVIITADSAVAHIAGAMNKPCYLLLPPIPNWYWFLDREESPWYPSIHILRKGRHEAWEDVARRLQALLAKRFRVNARRA